MPSSSPTRDRTPSQFPPGAVIAQRYRIDSVIAEGGMGIVYRGWHLTLDQPIAIKVVRPEYVDNPEAVARFLNEARAVAALRAVNVAQVLDVGRIRGGVLYMVMEYLEGSDLRDVLDRDGAFSLERAVDCVRQACAAMHEAHGAGIVHRDLKPENLFLARLPDGREVLKVIDFGISKRPSVASARSFTEAGRSLGSPHYMAPEQISTPEAVDGRADVWSLGVVLFELLTNALPYDADTVAATCAKVLCGEPASLAELRPDLAPEFVAIVNKCLSKDREQRFATVDELSEALEPFGSPQRASRGSLGSHPGHDDGRDTAPPVVQGPGLSSVRRRGRAVLPLAVALGVAACVGLAASNWQAVRQDAANVATQARAEARFASRATASAVRSARIHVSDWLRPDDYRGAIPVECAPTPSVEPTRVATKPASAVR
jgi:eukaryotic-like serine/threonine-protein kinase